MTWQQYRYVRPFSAFCYQVRILATLVIATGCSNTDIVAQIDDFPNAELPAYCPLPGPPIDSDGPPFQDDGQCPERIAANVFTQAVCICSELTVDHLLEIDGFDSRFGPYNEATPGRPGGTLAINQSLQANDVIQISADLIAAGTDGIDPGPQLSVGGSLATNGGILSADSRVDIGGGAIVGGDIALTAFTVSGTLTTAPGTAIAISEQEQINATASADVAIPAPCPCATDQRLDVTQIIAAQALANDNAVISLDPAALSGLRADTNLILPCGRFFLDRIQGNQRQLTLRIEGRTGLYIANGITLGGSLRIELAPDASLDLFVTGVINVGGNITLGDTESPQRLRIYVGEVGAINFSGQSLLAGNLYAPQSTLSIPAGAEIFGSIFADRMTASDRVRVHYDAAIQAAPACQ